MLVGYSKKSLVEKLGIREGFRVFIINPPEDYDKSLGKLPKGAVVADTLKGENKHGYGGYWSKTVQGEETKEVRLSHIFWNKC